VGERNKPPLSEVESSLAKRIFADKLLTIRTLADEDLIKVAQLDDQLFESSWPVDSLRKELENKVSVNIVVCDDTSIVGYTTTWMIVDELQINKIAVVPAYRNLGIASWMLEYILQCAKQFEMLSVYIEVRRSNASAIHLYEKFGFSQFGVRINYYDSPKEDALLMKLLI